MSKKLYVGNLSNMTSSGDLLQLFSQAGTVSSSIVIWDRETGEPKGFGFVEMATPDDAQTAIDLFNGFEKDGRRIRVDLARTRGGSHHRRSNNAHRWAN